MTTATQLRPAQLPASSSPDLQDRYFDVVDLYVRNRVQDADTAAAVVARVFARSCEEPARVQAGPLPWLIHAARHECAMARRNARRSLLH